MLNSLLQKSGKVLCVASGKLVSRLTTLRLRVWSDRFKRHPRASHLIRKRTQEQELPVMKLSHPGLQLLRAVVTATLMVAADVAAQQCPTIAPGEFTVDTSAGRPGVFCSEQAPTLSAHGPLMRTAWPRASAPSPFVQEHGHVADPSDTDLLTPGRGRAYHQMPVQAPPPALQQTWPARLRHRRCGTISRRGPRR